MPDVYQLVFTADAEITSGPSAETTNEDGPAPVEEEDTPEEKS